MVMKLARVVPRHGSTVNTEAKRAAYNGNGCSVKGAAERRGSAGVIILGLTMPLLHGNLIVEVELWIGSAQDSCLEQLSCLATAHMQSADPDNIPSS